MSNDNESVGSKKARQMTIKSFLKKANAGVSARAFLGEHREWIANQPGGDAAISVIKEVEAIVLMPTPALEKVKKILEESSILNDLAEAQVKIQNRVDKANDRMIKATLDAEEKASKPEKADTKFSVAAVFDANDNLVYEEVEKIEIKKVNGKEVSVTRIEQKALNKDFDLPQQAKRWAARKLVELPGCYAMLTDKRFVNIIESMNRDQAAAYLKGHAKSPVTHKAAVGPGSQKCKQDSCHFSRG
jgi:hypothetical protein